MFDTKDVKVVCELNDVIEFAKRYNLLYKEQKAMIELGDFKGSIDDYALELGYSAPASTIFRRRVKEMINLGLLEVVDSENSDGRKKQRTFHINNGSELINQIVKIPLYSFSYSTKKALSKKNVDKREELKLKKRKTDISKNVNKEKILELYNNGMKQSDIAKQMNVSRQYIGQVINK